MPTMRPTYRRSSGLVGRLILYLLLAALAAGGAVAGLWFAGMLHLPWRQRVAAPIPPGYVAVPLCLRTIPAGTRVAREHLFDPQTLKPRTVPLEQELVARRGVLVNPQDIVGRVLAREKREGYSFTEADFHPAGTRAGLVALIPPGKRSLTIEAARIEGVFGLNAGDHVDLLATVMLDAKRSGRGSAVPAIAGLGGAGAAAPQARVLVLAHDAVVVMPVTTRQKPVASATLTQGMRVRTVPVQEIVLAVDPDEVAGITEALATEALLTCVARSGLPTAGEAERETTGKDPLAGLHTIEAITGKGRELFTFPVVGATPAPAMTAAAGGGS